MGSNSHVVLSMVLGSFVAVVQGMCHVAMRRMGMVSSLLVVTGFVMFLSLGVVMGGHT
jgi:hypothetical protein